MYEEINILKLKVFYLTSNFTRCHVSANNIPVDYWGVLFQGSVPIILDSYFQC